MQVIKWFITQRLNTFSKLMTLLILSSNHWLSKTKSPLLSRWRKNISSLPHIIYYILSVLFWSKNLVYSFSPFVTTDSFQLKTNIDVAKEISRLPSSTIFNLVDPTPKAFRFSSYTSLLALFQDIVCYKVPIYF